MKTRRRAGRRRGLALPWILMGVGVSAMVGTVVWDYFKDPEADPVQRFLNGSEWTREHRRRKERLRATGGPGAPASPAPPPARYRTALHHPVDPARREAVLLRLQRRFDLDGDGRIEIGEISAVRRGVPYEPAPPRPLRNLGPAPAPPPRHPAQKSLAGYAPPPPPGAPPAPPPRLAASPRGGDRRLQELFRQARGHHAELVAALERGDPNRIREAREDLRETRRQLIEERRSLLDV